MGMVLRGTSTWFEHAEQQSRPAALLSRAHLWVSTLPLLLLLLLLVLTFHELNTQG
jgi:hypothetical protein